MSQAVSEQAARVAELLAGSERAVVLTGAGVSVPSGIPDFRSPGTGLWENVDPMAVAHIDAFRRDPDQFWRFYGDRFATLEDKRPNPAHEAIAELERRGLIRGVITQNIDRLHRRAGSQRIVEVHGTIEWSVCLTCHRRLSIDNVLAQLRSGAGDAALRGLPRGAQAGRGAVRRAAARGGDVRGARPRRRGRPDGRRRARRSRSTRWLRCRA